MKMGNWHHTHPVTIIFTIKNFLFLLIFPLIRGIYSVLQADPGEVWINGTQYDIFTLVLILVGAAVYWFMEGYLVTEKEVFIRNGILKRSYDRFLYKNLSTVTVYQPFYLRPIKAVYCRINTGGGNYGQEIGFYLYKKQVHNLTEHWKITNQSKKPKKGFYKISFFQTVFLALTVTNLLSGVVLFTTFFNETQGLVDARLEIFAQESFSFIIAFLDQFIPKALTTLTLITVIGGVLGFLQQFMRYLNLRIYREDQLIEIKRGFLNLRTSLLKCNKLNFIAISQGAVLILLGYQLTRIGCLGYGEKSKEGKPVLLGVERKEKVWAELNKILPEYQKKEISLRNEGFKGIVSFFWQPTLFLAILLFVTIGGNLFLPHWTSLFILAGILLFIPIFFMYIVKIKDFCNSGIGKTENSYILQGSSFFAYHTIIIPKDRISRIVMRQTPPQRRKGLTTVYFHPYMNGKGYYVLRGMDLQKMQLFFNDRL